MPTSLALPDAPTSTGADLPLGASEDRIQAALVRWARSHPDERLRSLFHIPNGGARPGVTGGRMVALGAKRGVSDLFLPVPVLTTTVGMARLVPGLWVEMKTGAGRLSAAQADWLALMAGRGYAVAVCRSLEDAQATLLHYCNTGTVPTSCISDTKAECNVQGVSL
jgi:hypothetical protein